MTKDKQPWATVELRAADEEAPWAVRVVPHGQDTTTALLELIALGRRQGALGSGMSLVIRKWKEGDGDRD